MKNSSFNNFLKQTRRGKFSKKHFFVFAIVDKQHKTCKGIVVVLVN
jgi:hypothetical protein